jgi:hypothetical protein
LGHTENARAPVISTIRSEPVSGSDRGKLPSTVHYAFALIDIVYLLKPEQPFREPYYIKFPRVQKRVKC